MCLDYLLKNQITPADNLKNLYSRNNKIIGAIQKSKMYELCVPERLAGRTSFVLKLRRNGITADFQQYMEKNGFVFKWVGGNSMRVFLSFQTSDERINRLISLLRNFETSNSVKL